MQHWNGQRAASRRHSAHSILHFLFAFMPFNDLFALHAYRPIGSLKSTSTRILSGTRSRRCCRLESLQMDFILWAARIPLLGLAACPPVPVANCMDYERAPAHLLPNPSPMRSMRTRSGRHWHRLSANLSLQLVNHTWPIALWPASSSAPSPTRGWQE